MDAKITGSNWIESLALAAGVVPVASIEALLPAIRARAVMTAIEAGIFEALANGPLTAAEAGARCGLRSEGVSFLLRTLVWARYLEFQSPDRYALSKMGRESVLQVSAKSQIGFITLSAYAATSLMPQLGDCLRRGTGVDLHRTMTDPAMWAAYQRAMMEGARFSAATLARLTPVKRGALRLLDVAGSHGLLGAAICKRHPPMRSAVLDLPMAIPHARALAKTLGIDDVVEHREGDLLTGSFGEGNDVVLFSNIIHNIERELIPSVLRRAFESCTTGGTVAIWEVETPDSTKPPAHGDAYALYCWLISSSGVFTSREYAEWLAGAGLTDIVVKHPKRNPGQVLVTGRKGSGAR